MIGSKKYFGTMAVILLVPFSLSYILRMLIVIQMLSVGCFKETNVDLKCLNKLFVTVQNQKSIRKEKN